MFTIHQIDRQVCRYVLSMPFYETEVTAHAHLSFRKLVHLWTCCWYSIWRTVFSRNLDTYIVFNVIYTLSAIIHILCLGENNFTLGSVLIFLLLIWYTWHITMLFKDYTPHVCVQSETSDILDLVLWNHLNTWLLFVCNITELNVFFHSTLTKKL